MADGRRSAVQTRVQFFSEDHQSPSRLGFGSFLQLAMKTVLIIESDHATHLSVSGRPGLAWPRPQNSGEWPGSVETVPEPASPTVRRRRLAAELRRLRERADLTGDFVAGQMGWSASKVSRIENAHVAPRPTEIKKLLALYGIEGKYADELMELAQEAKRKGWWKAYSDALPDLHTNYIGLEAEATAAWHWSPEVVPGLLQTEDYAREVLRTANGAAPPREIERMIEARMVRQRLLHRDPPFKLTAVIDESVLMRLIGSDAIMLEQINRLLEGSEYPHLSP